MSVQWQEQVENSQLSTGMASVEGCIISILHGLECKMGLSQPECSVFYGNEAMLDAFSHTPKLIKNVKIVGKECV